ncbi:endonuclease/exonuclease/phosphatase family protein [Streptomyces albipurpureus]|uniref:Endonuclease/exonuclease/phosphatase family protein n=1 Tax=Streptomyces albipurpureus TaxID=2897419 RepID=A0ABT0ULH3_9ACTN|nr:endonuclease/exonuclease/phosphatase family protein [Streptomyces sp. CWNU-1]MCM2388955.1 endonuclease/exonuclease/phosphatase family protein [Streptomyces sp. CWNU-1]
MDSATSTTAPDALPDAPLRPPAHRRAAGWFAALLLVIPTVVVACRVMDTDAATPIPQLLAFLPWLLIPAGAALLLMLLARWRTGMVWAVIVLGVTGWFVRPYDSGLAEDPGGRAIAQFDVLTSNVEFGNATQGLIATIQREQPDLVFVQECAAQCSDALESEISPAEYPYRHVIEGSMAIGSAILSKYPLQRAPGIQSTMAMPGAVAVISGVRVNIQLAHPLPPIPSGVDDWRRELELMREYAVEAKGQPTLVAGDFNASQDHAAFRRIMADGDLQNSSALGGASRTPSWPTAVGRPLGTQIDHVLVSEEFSVRKARFLELGNTDHRSLLVRLDLHEAN